MRGENYTMLKKSVIALMVLVFMISGNAVGLAAEDTTPLKLKKTTINKTSAKIGDKVTMTFEIENDYESGPSTDDDSAFIVLRHSSGTEIATQFGYSGNNVYKFDWVLDDSTLKGEWHVEYIQLKDKAGNDSFYFYSEPLIEKLHYTVTNGINDTEPPKLSDVKVLTPSAKPNEKVKMEVVMSDESKLMHGHIQFKHALTDTYLSGSFYFNEVKNKYEVIADMPEDVKNGTWNLYAVYLTDKYDNSKTYTPRDYPFLNNLKFNVAGGISDFSKPIFRSASLVESKLYAGDTLTALVDAEDKDSGIGRVTISFTHKVTGHNFWDEMVWDEKLGKYRLDFPISISQMTGDYRIDQITIQDKVHNLLFVYPNTPGVTLPTLTIKPLFTGVNSMGLIRGTSFDPMSGVAAYSTSEDDLTSSIKVEGEVDTNQNGIYLLKYSVPSKNRNYVYRNYRWVTVNEEKLMEPNQNDGTTYFNTDVVIGVPENDSVSLKNGNKIMTLTTDTHLVTEGTYQIVTSDSAARTASISDGRSIGTVSKASVSTTKAGSNFRFVIDKTAPAAPLLNTVTTNSTSISGKTEAGAKVKIYVNNKYLKSVKADSKGNYKTYINKQKINTDVKINSTDVAGNRSKYKMLKVVHAPTLNAVTNKSSSLSGEALPYAKVNLYLGGKYYKSGIANKYGYYKISIPKQPAGKKLKVTETVKGKVSPATSVLVLDRIPPAAPVVNKVSYTSTSVTGKGEKGASVYILNGTKQLARAKVSSNATFKVYIAKQKRGTTITIYLVDTAGNKSTKKLLKVQ